MMNDPDNYLLKALVAAAVSVGIVLGIFGLAGAADADESQVPAKNEIVYAKTDASGQVCGVYVVNFFETDTSEQVADPANYERVENLSTTDELVQENGVVSLTTTAGAPFYYQGDMASSTRLPWGIEVSYELDGKRVDAEDVAGASGELTVSVKITPDTETANLSDFANAYLVQAQGTFDNDSFSIEDAGEATVAQAGESTSVTCLVLPGESGEFSIKGKASDFEYSGWQVAAMSLSLSIDLASMDTSQLTQGTDELQSALLSASNGSSSVSSGASQLASGAESLSEGLAQLDGSGSSLLSGWAQMSSALSSANSGASQLAQGTLQLQQAVSSAKDEASGGAEALAAAQQQYAQALSEYTAAVAVAVQTGGDPSAVDKSALNAALQAVVSAGGVVGAYQALDGLDEGVGEVAAGASSLSSGLSAIDSGSATLENGLSAYLQGIESASSGASELSQGAQTLASGSAELQNGMASLVQSTSGLDKKVIEQIQQRIDEKLGVGFEPHSFVVPGNTNVGAVQFVYVVEGVSVADEDADDAQDDEETTLFERIAAIFGF